MARCGRPPVLDEMKQREILAILSMGCSRRTAARYVGCATTTIQNTAERDGKFAEKLDRAENQAVVTHMKNINSAAKKAQYWRAAAWALERLNPEEYASQHPDAISAEQISRLLAYLAQIVMEEVRVDAYRKKIVKRLKDLTEMVSAVAPSKHAEDAKSMDDHKTVELQ